MVSVEESEKTGTQKWGESGGKKKPKDVSAVSQTLNVSKMLGRSPPYKNKKIITEVIDVRRENTQANEKKMKMSTSHHLE